MMDYAMHLKSITLQRMFERNKISQDTMRREAYALAGPNEVKVAIQTPLREDSLDLGRELKRSTRLEIDAAKDRAAKDCAEYIKAAVLTADRLSVGLEPPALPGLIS